MRLRLSVKREESQRGTGKNKDLRIFCWGRNDAPLLLGRAGKTREDLFCSERGNGKGSELCVNERKGVVGWKTPPAGKNLENW